MNPSAVPPKQPDRRKIPSDGFLFLNPSESRTGAGVRYGSDCRKTLLEKGLAEFRRPQTTEGKEAPSFPATRASEMTPLMTDRETFLPESSPVRHVSLCRKRPKAFFDKLSRTGAGVRHGFFQVPKRCPKRRRSGTYENVGEICRRKLTKCSNSGMFNWAAAEDAEAQADQESSRNPY